jgi:hypothetical protein
LTGAGGASGYWGSFWSTQNQTAAAINTAYAITYNNTDPDGIGVSISNSSRVNFAFTGVYSITFSVQWSNASNQIHDANIWLRKNGVNVDDTDSRWSVVEQHGGTNGRAVGTVNYVLKVLAGEYLELFWQTTNTNISLEYFGALAPAPAIPSIILTATQVMYGQLGATGATGVGATGSTGATGVGATGATGVVDFTNYLASIGQSSSVIETTERNSALTTTAANSGILFLMMITPVVNTTVTKLSINVTTAATGTVTLFRMGIYSFNEGTDTATLLASTANVTTAVTAIQLSELALTTPTSITLVAGTRYAIGFIGTGYTTSPSMSIASIATVISALPPVMSRSISGQTDLPATVVATTSPGARFWLRASS